MKYLYQIDNNLRYIYYITPKCATRTFFKLFNYNGVPFRKINSNHNDYFSWGFVRNPWDRLVSTYVNKIINQHGGGLGLWGKDIKHFKDFILKIKKTNVTDCDRHIRCLYTFLPEDINFIGKIENLQEDFNTICDKIGLPHTTLPHANKTKHQHYTKYYENETREIVAEKYSRDIEYFGYKFGE